jgi:hypothetical protein
MKAKKIFTLISSTILVGMCMTVFFNAKRSGGKSGSKVSTDPTCTYGPTTKFGSYLYTTDGLTAFGNYQNTQAGETAIFEYTITSGVTASSTCPFYRVLLRTNPALLTSGFSMTFLDANSNNGAVISESSGDIIDVNVTPGSTTIIRIAMSSLTSQAVGSSSFVQLKYALYDSNNNMLFDLTGGMSRSFGSGRTTAAELFIIR